MTNSSPSYNLKPEISKELKALYALKLFMYLLDKLDLAPTFETAFILGNSMIEIKINDQIYAVTIDESNTLDIYRIYT